MSKEKKGKKKVKKWWLEEDNWVVSCRKHSKQTYIPKFTCNNMPKLIWNK